MDTALAVVAGRGYAVKRVAEVLGVSRSQLTERLKGAAKPRSAYFKTEDAELLKPLRSLVDERPTYGYRRIAALLNRERLKNSLPRVNHKRVYRLMSQNGMLLQQYTGKPSGRVHDGKIITIRPNLRWTSDGFEIACWTATCGRSCRHICECGEARKNREPRSPEGAAFRSSLAKGLSLCRREVALRAHPHAQSSSFRRDRCREE